MAVEHQSSRSTYVIIAAFVAIAVAGFWWTWGRGDTQAAQQKKKGPVVISVLAGKAQKKDVPYRVEFSRYCAAAGDRFDSFARR